MMTTIRSYGRLWKHTLHLWLVDPRVHTGVRAGLCLLSGFFLSAASLAHQSLPLVLGLICAMCGSRAALVALGGSLGYLLFWGVAGLQGLMWCALGLGCVLILDRSGIGAQAPLLPIALAGLATAFAGLCFQQWGDDTALPMYLLRIALAGGATYLFSIVLERRDTVADWLAAGVTVLALAQVVPFRWLNLGYPVAAALTVAGAFPAAALAGLALDLAGVTPMPMTAVLGTAWLLRLLPAKHRLLRGLSPALAYSLLLTLVGKGDLLPLPGLLLGGLAGLLLPTAGTFVPRRGEVGVAQVRLELMSSVYSQMQQLLLELQSPEIDQKALILRACERACGSCANRKTCVAQPQVEALNPQMLNFPILDSSLSFPCRKPTRLLQELRRSQEHLRTLRASHRQREECRGALVQQYRFLAEYLQDLSDDLSKRTPTLNLRYTPEVVFRANRKADDNGDRCMSFSGTGGRHYVAIFDGMGTGIGAMDEANTAGRLLKKLLTAGFPVEYALSTLNSLCALRDRAGAVTVDLAELRLDSGKVSLYKWGAPPSWLITRLGSEKIGTAGPPPGLSVADRPEAAQRLSLRRGEMLALLSDGVDGEDALRCHVAAEEEPLGEIAARILESGSRTSCDDATVALIRLSCADLSA